MVHRFVLRILGCVLIFGYLSESPFFRSVGQAESYSTRLDTQLAKHLRNLSGISSGVCTLIGSQKMGNACGPLALSLAGEEGSLTGNFFVHILSSSSHTTEQLRATISQQGFYGNRVVVEQHSFGRLPYAGNMIDLLLAIDLTPEELEQLSADEIHRVLRPGGQAVLGHRTLSPSHEPLASNGLLDAWIKQLTSHTSKNTFEVTEEVTDNYGRWIRLAKPIPEGIDSWSHWEHGPDNNPVSDDAVIQAPYRTQWLGLPLYIAMPAISTSAGGKLYIAMGHIAHHAREEPWLNTLLARNAYNGSTLWQRKLPDGYLVHRSAFIATDDTFYMIDEGETGCLLLDPDTGQEKGRVSPDALGGLYWKWMALQDGILYVLAGKKSGAAQTTIVRSSIPHWSWGELSKGYYQKRVPWGFGTRLLAYDLKNQKTRWVHQVPQGIDSRAMTLGPEHLFYYGPESHVGCLKITDGKPVWTNEDPEVRKLIERPGEGLSSTPGFRSACFTLYTPQVLCFEGQTRMNVVALSTDQGKLLWSRPKTTSNPNMIYADKRLYVGVGEDGSTLAIDPVSGEIVEDLGFKKRSCARLTATNDSFFCRGWPEGLTRYDRKTGQVLFNGAFRPSCNDGVIPANGLLYVGPWACDCNLSVMGRVALCSASQFQPEPFAPGADRLEIGPTANKPVIPLPVSPLDWPTYRGNNSRTAASQAKVGTTLSRLWQHQPKTTVRLTAPTAAGGLIFLGGDDGLVRSIDAKTGKQVWNFPTGGPILQPPTIDAGRAYVGSGDGYVYSLEASTGRLLWRFHVAPYDRRIMAYGKLSSTWPVHSGVLVDRGVAYAAAGIIDYDGTYLCALDAKKGELKWRNESSGHLDPKLRKGISAQGTLTIAQGKLWMAGGNVVSPAAYQLENGNYVGAPVGDGSPQANRGEEIALFGDNTIMLGGRLRYSAVRNVVNPGSFTLQSLQPDQPSGREVVICEGKIAPAWDERIVATIDGRDKPLAAYETGQLKRYVDHYAQPDKRSDRPSPKWTSTALTASDTLSVVVAQDAVLTICKTPRFRHWKEDWTLCLWDRDQGKLLHQVPVPGECLPGGLLVDREGRVVVVLQDGSVACYGSAQALLATIKSRTKTSPSNPKKRAETVRFLYKVLDLAHSTEARQLIQSELLTLGVQPGDRATQQGNLAHWHLLAPVPWDEIDHPLEKHLPLDINGEKAQIDVHQPITVNHQTLAWHPYTTDQSNGKVDLAKVFGPRTQVAAYAYAEITLPESADLLLKVGSNDGFVCWFNGQEVGRYEGGRSFAPNQNSLPVHARHGVNHILLKVSQMGGKWAYSARLTDSSGKPIDLRHSSNK